MIDLQSFCANHDAACPTSVHDEHVCIYLSVRIPLRRMPLEFTIFSRKTLTAYGPGGNRNNVSQSILHLSRSACACRSSSADGGVGDVKWLRLKEMYLQ